MSIARQIPKFRELPSSSRSSRGRFRRDKRRAFASFGEITEGTPWAEADRNAPRGCLWDAGLDQGRTYRAEIADGAHSAEELQDWLKEVALQNYIVDAGNLVARC